MFRNLHLNGLVGQCAGSVNLETGDIKFSSKVTDVQNSYPLHAQ